jgi:Zn-finger nucleic acid-binding protein
MGGKRYAAIRCPDCQITMYRVPTAGPEVDLCRSCQLIWFDSGEPGFIVDKAMFVQMVDSEASWTSFTVEEPRVTSLTPDTAILVYRATGKRTGQPDYVALMSSIYVKRDGRWRLAHHQQTPQPS